MRKKIACFSFIVMLVLCVICTGCASKPRRGAEDNILDYQRKINELENTVRCYEAAIDDTVRTLTELRDRAEDMEATVDGLIELFGQYQRLVEQLLYYYNALRNEVKDTVQSVDGTISNNYNTNDYYDNWLCVIPEKYKGASLVGYIALVPEKEDGKTKQIKKCKVMDNYLGNTINYIHRNF